MRLHPPIKRVSTKPGNPGTAKLSSGERLPVVSRVPLLGVDVASMSEPHDDDQQDVVRDAGEGVDGDAHGLA